MHIIISEDGILIFSLQERDKKVNTIKNQRNEFIVHYLDFLFSPISPRFDRKLVLFSVFGHPPYFSSVGERDP